jgi:hypothetical protein
MDDLIAQIQEKTGLSAEKVLEVVTMVTDFLKEKLPADLVSQITATLSKGASSAGTKASDAAGTGASNASQIAGAVAGAAGAALSKTLDAASSLLPDPKDGSDKE